ncbi:MAG: PDZ domain-containing protein [Ignavibacteriales bacterium]|nr:PDZ domain-containing protein [Ignavibacteriales bacterium]
MKRAVPFLLILLLPTMMLAQSPGFDYTLGMSKPSSHLLEVELSARNLPAGTTGIDYLLPVWRTGRYVIFDFAGGVQEFSATDGSGATLRWAKTDKSTWHVEKGRSTGVTIRYKVYANEAGERTRGLNDDHAFVDACAVFMYVERYRHLPLTVAVKPYQDWHVTSGLESDPHDALKLLAPNYDVLADSPIEVGRQKDFAFDVEGKKHILMIYGEAQYNAETMVKDLTTIVKANKEFWGDLPYNKYVFMLHITSRGGGGTEHLNSTIMQTSPASFRTPAGYQGFLGLVSHEYFHTWNVKQLRPKGILPYDFMHENYVKELWIAEGTTSYFDGLLLVRCGLHPAGSVVNGLGAIVQNDRQRPGNKVQSLSESSFDAWVKFWKGGQQSFNAESDYYGKGSNVSMLLDLEIRQRSDNKHSLDDVMRALYRRFPITSKGYTVDDLQKISEELAGSSLKSFFVNYVHATTPLDWETALRYAGLDLQAMDSERKPWLGAMTFDQAGRTMIRGIITGSPAYDAGLDIGDEILAINSRRVRNSDLPDRVAEFKPGEKVKVTLFREDALREFDVTLRLQDVPPYKVVKTANPTPLQKSIYESWLKTKWE